MILLPSKHGADGTVIRICENIPTGRVVVPITRIENFEFNDELLKYKEAIILDYVEYGYDWNLEKSGTHIFGVNTNNFPHFRGEEWKKFDDWVAGLERKIYFKREMLKDVYPDYIHPIDYPSWYIVPDPVSKEDFEKRPLEVLFYWGRSHEGRLKLHGNIWLNASAKGYDVCDNIYQLNNFLSHKNEGGGGNWATFNIPYYARIDMGQFLPLINLSKLCIAPFGAGRKTFRHSEASLNSISVIWEDNLMWAYKWDETNSIVTKEGEEIEAIEKALSNPNLYDIYVNCVNNCKNYQIDNYVKNYLLPIINTL